MSRWIKSFENATAIQNAVDNGDLLKPYVAYDESAATIDWNTKYYDPKEHYLTFTITSDGNIVYKPTPSATNKVIYYSKNDGEWTSISSTKAGATISVVSGDIVKFKGDNPTYTVTGSTNKVTTFSESTCGFKLSGNIMSLVNSTGFSTETTLQSPYTFNSMFRGCTGLTDASNLVLPATALTNNCYEYLFYGCTSLTTAPELPATTLAQACYQSMFTNCNLTTAPELLATTYVWNSYGYMLNGNSNLNYIKCLVEGTDLYFNNWVKDVPQSGTFVKSQNATWTTGASGIPSNWTVQDA